MRYVIRFAVNEDLHINPGSPWVTQLPLLLSGITAL